MDREHVMKLFTDAAVEILGVEAGQVTPEARFNQDLGADSLDVVELVMMLEQSLQIEVDEEELEGVETVGAAIDLILTKTGAAA